MPPAINQRINVIVEYFTKNAKGFAQVMNLSQQQFRDLNTKGLAFNKVQKNLTTTGANMANRFRLMTHGLRGFRMEMLGVMFFGMMINRAFMGLIKTSLEWVGVNEILTQALGILFLPVALMLLDWALLFLEFVSKIPEPIQKFIGVIVLLGAALGSILFLIGSFALGIGSVILAFGGMSGVIAVISQISAFFVAFGGTVLLVVGIVVALIVSMVDAWNKNFMNMRNTVANLIDGIKKIFSGLWDIIKGVVNVVLGILTGDFERFSLGVKQIFVGLKDFVVGIFKTLANAVLAILTGIVNIFRNIVNFALKVGAAIGNLITGKGFTTGGALEIPAFQRGGLVPGRIGTPVPVIAHAGERIVPAGRSPGTMGSGEPIIFNVTYNVNVADRRELEMMLRENNIKLTEEVRRLTK